MEERISKLEVRTDDLEEDMREVKRIIDGPPRPDSLRGRLHALESDRAAARAAEAAVSAALAIRESTSERVFGKREKLIALALAVVVVFLQLASFIVTTR